MYPAAPNFDNDAPDDAATFWFARMNSGRTPSLEDEAGYHAWLQADPSNIESYRRCQLVWRDLGLDAASPEIMSLRAKALGGARTPSRRRALFGLTGTAVAASVAGVWVMTASSPARALMVTRAGQRLTAPLPDGSQVTLAPLTRLRLDFIAGRRTVLLEAGQAWFDAQVDGRRPFQVLAGKQRLSAEGGRFQVTLVGESADVVVEDGAMTVAGLQGAGASTVRLTRGQKASWTDLGITVAPTDVETDTAWRLGRLVVRDRPLREVVEAFNRYSSDRLVLGDAEAGAVRISGSFRYDGSSDFVTALGSGFDLAVSRREDGAWRIATPEGTATLR